MSVITAKGKGVKDSVNRESSKIDLKSIFIKIKENESIKVRLLSDSDYVEYPSHGDYTTKIFTQPCSKKESGKCALCEASWKNLEKFKSLYVKRRYLFIFADLDKGILRVFDATKSQAKILIDQIEQYADSIDEVAFNFKRIGKEKETNYSLNPILKLNESDRVKFNVFNNLKVEDSFYDEILISQTYEKQIEYLRNAGFPVEEL